MIVLPRFIKEHHHCDRVGDGNNEEVVHHTGKDKIQGRPGDVAKQRVPDANQDVLKLLAMTRELSRHDPVGQSLNRSPRAGRRCTRHRRSGVESRNESAGTHTRHAVIGALVRCHAVRSSPEAARSSRKDCRWHQYGSACRPTHREEEPHHASVLGRKSDPVAGESRGRRPRP